MEINKEVPPLQIDGLQTVETQIARMQGEIFALRQFLEAAIINNDNAPNQEFNPLV